MSESSYGKIFQKISSKFSNAGGGGRKGKKSKTKFELNRTFVDLTPDSYFINIKTRRSKRQMVYTNVMVLGLCILGLGGAFAYNFISSNELNGLKSNSSTIADKLAKFQEENLAIEQVKNIQGKLDIAEKPSVDWSSLIATIEGSLPSGTIVSSLSVNVDSELGAGRSSNIRVTLNSDNPLGYADTLASINGIENISNVVIGGMSGGGSGQYLYSATFDFDESFRVNSEPEEVANDAAEEFTEEELLEGGISPEDLLREAMENPAGVENEETE